MEASGSFQAWGEGGWPSLPVERSLRIWPLEGYHEILLGVNGGD